MALDITQEHLDKYEQVGGLLIQAVFPNLSAGEREFLINGITPEEWNKTFGEDDGKE